MATGDVEVAGSKTSTSGKKKSGSTGLLDHLAALRLGTVQRFSSEVSRLFALAHKSFFGLFIVTTILSIMARVMNILALAGTIKVAALILFNWQGAREIGVAVGLPLQNATKADIAWIAAAVILSIYLLAGLAGYFSKRTQASLTGHTELVLYKRYLHHPAFHELQRIEDFRPAATRSIATYARSTVSLALIPGLATVCTIILLVLAVSQPMLIAIVLIAILPLLLLYLLTGRRVSVAAGLLKSTEAHRLELIRSITGKKRKQPTPEAVESTRDEIVRLTSEISHQRRRLKVMKSSP